MDRFNARVLAKFVSPANVQKLEDVITSVNYIPNQSINSQVTTSKAAIAHTVHACIADWVIDFHNRKKREWLGTEVVGYNFEQHLADLNEEFCDNYIELVANNMHQILPTYQPDNQGYKDNNYNQHNNKFVASNRTAVNPVGAGYNTQICKNPIPPSLLPPTKQPQQSQFQPKPHEMSRNTGQPNTFVDEAMLRNIADYKQQKTYTMETRDNTHTNWSATNNMRRDKINPPYNHQTDMILESWKHPTRGVQMRDDAAGMSGHKDLREDHGRNNINYHNSNSQQDQLLSTNYSTSLNFRSDSQQSFNPSEPHHIDALLNNQRTKSLNNNKKLWQDDNGVIDEANPEAMDKYMNRSLFRSYATSKTMMPSMTTTTDDYGNIIPFSDQTGAQIPFYRKALHSRQYERDVEENVGGFEYGNMQRGHDTNSQICRLRTTYHQPTHKHRFSATLN